VYRLLLYWAFWIILLFWTIIRNYFLYTVRWLNWKKIFLKIHMLSSNNSFLFAFGFKKSLFYLFVDFCKGIHKPTKELCKLHTFSRILSRKRILIDWNYIFGEWTYFDNSSIYLAIHYKKLSGLLIHSYIFECFGYISLIYDVYSREYSVLAEERK
jgi:hypothetical protein